LADNLVVAVFACSSGRDVAQNNLAAIGSYAQELVCDPVGVRSLGWTLHHELAKAGLRNTVWAHSTAAHTTRNSYLRVFSSWGSADYLNLLIRSRGATPACKTSYVENAHYTATQTVAVFRARLAVANQIRVQSLQSGMYLAWSWDGGSQVDEHTSGYDAEAERAAEPALGSQRDAEPFSLRGSSAWPHRRHDRHRAR
jgi:hypothetical protein